MWVIYSYWELIKCLIIVIFVCKHCVIVKIKTRYTPIYYNASFANLPGGGSQGGFIILLRGPVGSRCPIYWQTRKILRVVKSTLAAEALALLECAEAAVYVAAVMSELVMEFLRCFGHISIIYTK